jgi:hypothetical protein
VIWVAWRQHRASILAAGGVLAALGTLLLVTGLGMRSTFDRLGLDRCAAPIEETCAQAASQFSRSQAGNLMFPLLLVVPALVGLFWGAPLVAREIEQGTHRFAWTQSVTRQRWLLTKVGLLALVTMVGLALMTVAVNWWAAPINAVHAQQFEAGTFDLLGPAPLGYGLLALAVGVAAGTFSRHLIPAIGITLLVFLVLRVGTVVVLRPHYMAPVQVEVAFPDNPGGLELPTLPSDIGWGVSVETLDARGNRISEGVGLEYPALVAACPELGETVPGSPIDQQATAACAKRISLHVRAVYQPEDRFWRFQATELAVNVVLSAAMLGVSVWWLRRRRA